MSDITGQDNFNQPEFHHLRFLFDFTLSGVVLAWITGPVHTNFFGLFYFDIYYLYFIIIIYCIEYYCTYM